MSCKEKGYPVYLCTFKRKTNEEVLQLLFKHCETGVGFCINRIHPVEFVLKSEENPLLRQILSKMEFPTKY